MRYFIGILLTGLIFGLLIPVSAADETGGGDMGWYVIHCNVYDAKVYLDDKYVGNTPYQGTLTVPALTSGTSYKTIRIQKYGYTTYSDSLSEVPGKDMTVDLYATLNPATETTQTSIGGEMGWYVVHCNVDGATVLFDTSNKGEITRGTVYVPVYSTATPYRSLTVKKDGFATYTSGIEEVPAKGETVHLYAVLSPLVTTAVITSDPVGGDIGWYTVHCNVNGATVSFDNEEKGKITDGRLNVQVYVTGTPYRTFTVYNAGYAPYTGSIVQIPEKGETVDLYAALNAPAATPSPSATTQKSSVSGVICILSLAAAGILLPWFRR